MIYLDHNATTPVPPEVFEAMTPFFTERWGNPSSSYRFGSGLKGVIETARNQVAELVGARPSEIVFTGNATESNNTAIQAALKAHPTKHHIITSQVEHSSVLNYCRMLESNHGSHGLATKRREQAQEAGRVAPGAPSEASTHLRGGQRSDAPYHVTYLPVDRDGLLNLADLENALTDETAVVSLMWANNETGVLFPVREIAELCRSRGVLFHCDAVQAVGKVPVDVSALPVDYLSLTGHKLGAPKGVGALYIRRKAPFAPLIHGGHQERGRRGGTECVPLIVGLGRAAELALKKLPDYERTVRPLRDALEAGILGTGSSGRESAPSCASEDQSRLTSAATSGGIPGTPIMDAELNGHPDHRLANTTNITFRGIESEALLILLDQEGICASSGSACLADSDEPSHVVKAMKPDTGAVRQMIRFSLGIDNTMPEVEATIAAVRRAVRALKG